MNKSIPFFLFLTFYFVASALAAESVQLNTYYPSPYGVYQKLRMYPLPLQNDATCTLNNAGTMYMNEDDHKMYFCMDDFEGNTPPTMQWTAFEASVWKQIPVTGQPSNMIPTGTPEVDPMSTNIRIGVGTSHPMADLDILGTNPGSAQPLGQNMWFRAGGGSDRGRVWIQYGPYAAPLLVMSDENASRILFQKTTPAAGPTDDQTEITDEYDRKPIQMASIGFRSGPNNNSITIIGHSTTHTAPTDTFFIEKVNTKVGINTGEDPLASLEVEGGIRVSRGDPSGDTTDRGYAFGKDGDTGLFSLGDLTESPAVNPTSFTKGNLALMLDGDPWLYLSSKGNVGIMTGSTPPGNKFEVRYNDNDMKEPGTNRNKALMMWRNGNGFTRSWLGTGPLGTDDDFATADASIQFGPSARKLKIMIKDDPYAAPASTPMTISSNLVSVEGSLQVFSGTASVQGTACADEKRGSIYFVKGGAGVNDEICVCAKTASGTKWEKLF